MATKTRNVFLDPKIARLREVSGHDGPWTSGEYEAAIGTLTSTRKPSPAPPPDLAELIEARDVAMAEFERVDTAWQNALAAERAAQHGGQVRISRMGELLTDPATPRRLRKAKDTVAELTEARDVASTNLKRATNKWREADAKWRRQMIADEYHATARR